MRVCACARARARVCVFRARVRACLRARACVCVCVCVWFSCLRWERYSVAMASLPESCAPAASAPWPASEQSSGLSVANPLSVVSALAHDCLLALVAAACLRQSASTPAGRAFTTCAPTAGFHNMCPHAPTISPTSFADTHSSTPPRAPRPAQQTDPVALSLCPPLARGSKVPPIST